MIIVGAESTCVKITIDYLSQSKIVAL